MGKFKKEFTIKSIEEYISCVKEIYELEKSNNNSKHLFFRGQANEFWTLQPSVVRNRDEVKNHVKSKEYELNEKQLVLDFYHNASRFSLNYHIDNDRISLLVDMQHYEVPTRLLDWSLSPLSSLYFAVEKNVEPGKNAVVYVFNPWNYNKEIFLMNKVSYNIPKIHEIYIIGRALLSTYFDPKYFYFIENYIKSKYFYSITPDELEIPFAFVSNFINSRIQDQRGVFTIHGIKDIDLLKEHIFCKNAYCIIIESTKKKEIYQQLNWLYINEYTQYPDIKGIKEIVGRTKGFFNIEI